MYIHHIARNMAHDPEVYKAKRDVQAAASKRYYLKNRERILERQRAYDRAQAQDRREKIIKVSE
jgi:hypothetical protein